MPAVSAADVAAYGIELAVFEERLAALPAGGDIADDVDRRLLGSAMARVRWETDVLQLWRRQPTFYVDQTLGAVFDLLTPRDIDARRLGDVTRLLDATPGILALGRENLTGTAVAELAALTIADLAGIEESVTNMAGALADLRPEGWTTDRTTELRAAADAAGRALADYAHWLTDSLPTFVPIEPLGVEKFQWFLTEVALVPHTPAELLEIGRLEAERAAALEVLERNRNGTTGPRAAPPATFDTWQEQAEAEIVAEQSVRDFYTDRGLLSQPDDLRHYHTTLLPAYLEPIAWLGVPDDLTGPDRLDRDGSAYFPPPGPDLAYFYAANAHDPRAGVMHEGVHYQQLCLSWRHPRPVRRHYYDSTSNEGIAFYNEELMLASGMFDDAPRVREIVYNFMRLRAVRVVVDVQLATGQLDIDAAAAYLETAVPMDRTTARWEAAFFAATPGQAMTYQDREDADPAAARGCGT